MKLTSQQVKDQLHIGDTRLMKLIEEGKLVPVNKPAEGSKKFFRKFDSVAVNKLRMELKANGHDTSPRTPIRPAEPSPAKGVMSLLTEMNEKLDRLVKLWS